MNNSKRIAWSVICSLNIRKKDFVGGGVKVFLPKKRRRRSRSLLSPMIPVCKTRLMERNDMAYHRTSCYLAQKTFFASQFFVDLLVNTFLAAVARFEHVSTRKKLPNTLE